MDEYKISALSLLDKLTCLTREDTELEIFGAGSRIAHGHEYVLNPVLSGQEITDFERKFQIELPPDYRAFLEYVGNGGAGPGYGLVKLEDAICFSPGELGDSYLKTPFPFTQRVSYYETRNTVRYAPELTPCDSEPWVRGSLWLADHGCGTHSLLIVSGPCRNQVWLSSRQDFDMFGPDAPSFNDWYENWLDKSMEDFA